MDLRQLEYVVAVAEELNFTKAASRCSVTQSGLSTQVARLEHELGVRLFNRTSRSVTVSAAGDVLVPRARSLLAQVAAARSELAALGGVRTGRLRIGMIEQAIHVDPVIDGVLATFHRRHPGVEVVVVDEGGTTMIDQVENGDLDAAFVGLFADQVPSRMRHHLLADDPMIAVLHSGHALAAESSVSLEDLASAGPLIELPAGTGARIQVDSAFNRAGIVRSSVLELSLNAGSLRFVSRGFGAAVVPPQVAHNYPDIIVVEVAEPAPRHALALVHGPEEELSPCARAFVALVLERIRPVAGRSRRR